MNSPFRKPKRKWFHQPRDKEIKFINPDEKDAKKKTTESSKLKSSSNWDQLKKVIAETPNEPKSDKPVKKGTLKIGEKRKWQAILSRKAAKKQRMNEDTQTERKPTIWFDDVDPSLLEYVPESETVPSENEKTETASDGTVKSESKLVKPASFEGLTQALAMDCEMVGAGNSSILARVSIVNVFGHCVYDTFVRPTEKVTDYRTAVSGVRPKDVKDAPSFEEVQKKVFAMVDKRILVGHALRNDLQVLFLTHPRKMLRDTSRYVEFRKLFNNRTPSLKALTEKVLAVKIQSGEHNSIEDARAAMRLYTMYKVQWEKHIKSIKQRSKTARKDSKPKT